MPQSPHSTLLKPALLALVLLLGTGPASAQEEGGEGDVLVVGTKVAPPFALQGEDGVWRGIAIELWREVAAEMGVEYELEERTLEELLTGLEDGSLDLSVAALTVTAPRERRVDFSHSFHSSGLGIAVPASGGSGWTGVLRNLVDPRFLTVVASLVGVLFLAGFLVWLFERRRNPEQFEPGGKGLASAFWWSAVTMTTVGYGDKAPVSVGGRLVALLWMFASVIVISSFTAAIASSLTVARLATGIQGPEDLPQAVAAAVTGSTSAVYLDERHLRYLELATIDEVLDAVASGEADAAVYDEPILRYLVRTSQPGLRVLPGTFERQDYAVAVPEGSEHLEALNRALLATIDRPGWQNVLERYLGE